MVASFGVVYTLKLIKPDNKLEYPCLLYQNSNNYTVTI